jgi:hypothetical protein
MTSPTALLEIANGIDAPDGRIFVERVNAVYPDIGKL